MNATILRSPLLQVGQPRHDQPMLTIGRERAAFNAVLQLRQMGANPLSTHQLSNGLPYIAPDTGREHGPQLAPRAVEIMREIGATSGEAMARVGFELAHGLGR